MMSESLPEIGKKTGPAPNAGKRADRTGFDWALLLLCLVFYLLFPILDGPVWCKDSPSYATMNITREPLYPAFLAVFRGMFGEKGYLFPVVLAQSLLAAYAAWKLAMTIKEDKDGSRLLASLAVFFQFAVTLLCRFVAIRGSSYIDSIMTEGLGLSLYVLFVIQLYRYICGRRTRNLAGTACYALLLVCLRKQMLVTLLLMAAVFLLYDLIKRKRLRRLLGLLVLTVCVLLVSKGADRLYNYAVRGAFIEHSGNSMGALCTLIYTSAGEKDALRFEDETLRGLYRGIYTRAEEQGLLYRYAGAGWMELSTHYADSYDAIGYGIINPVVQGYVRERAGAEPLGEVESARQYDEICARMMRTLLGQDKGPLVRVYAANTWKGLINSVARVHPALNWAAAGAYLLYLALYLWLAVAGKQWNTVGNGEDGRERGSGVIPFAEIVLGGILLNSLVVGAMIFTQPRYMIYSMGLFYTALSLLIYDVIKAGTSRRAPRA